MAAGNHTIRRPDEPPDHALGRSRGGLTTKIHGASDGRCRSLSIRVTAGQAHDTTQFANVLDGIRTPRPGPSRPRLGAELGGRWSGMRFLLGPWRWMLLVYEDIEADDRVVVVTIQDARSSRGATAKGRCPGRE